MSGLREQLQSIYDVNRELTPKLVVDVARKPDHPLHDRFEWDDSVAGEKYREVQAADLIRSVRVRFVAGDDEKDVRAFLAVPQTDSPSSNYVPVEEVAADDFSRKLLLSQAEREWKALRRRYSHLQEFMALIRADLEDKSA